MSRSLADVTQIVMGQSPRGSECNELGQGWPLLNGPTEFTFHYPKATQYTTDPKRFAKELDLLFCVRGSTTGRMNWADQKYAIGRGLAAIRHTSSRELQPLVRAVIERNLPALLAQATGSTFPNLSRAQLGSIPWPSLNEEDELAISRLIGALDDKIELNRKMNETLEEIARTIFTSWFVNFDPVRAKAEGRQPEGMDAETAALFPDSFVDSELGKIPKGWLVGPLEQFIDVNPLRKIEKGSVATYLEMSNVPTSGSRASDWAKRPLGSGSKFQNGDTLLARITPCLENGKTCFVDFLREEEIGWGSTEFIVMSSKTPLPKVWTYLLARDPAFREHAVQSMNGSSGRQRVPNDAVKRYKSVFPDHSIVKIFDDILEPTWRLIREHAEESRTLEDIRDLLLPKLLSGEIQVSAADRVLAEVGV